MARICMNEACKLTATIEWKKGWDLKSGGIATLCYHCGSAYENLVFCETFHREESGWRECRLCGKRIHCGCIVSKDLHDYLDFGGIGCIRCSRKLENRSLRPIKALNGDVPNGFGPQSANNVCDMQSSIVSDRMDNFKIDKGKLIQAQVSNVMISNEKLIQLSKNMVENDGPLGKIKQEVCVATGFPDLLQQHVGPSLSAKQENPVPAVLGVRDMYESVDHPALSFSLGTPFHKSNTLAPSPGGVAIEEKELSKVPPFQQGQRARHIFSKSQKTGSDVNKGMVPEARVARPPAEGRGRNQLLPRYWPRITDQELQQISGDLNSTIVPLFEKVLSASDAGRIGRLVLPKACAEAYFPPISQSEGLPIRIQDIKGKEWTFQFRFWPNNNSRMYVLEGVTPCIQNMQLQAGDTVTFSRIDPGGKLVIGFRKASNSGDIQDCQPSALSNGTGSGEASGPGINDNRPFDGGGPNENMPPQRNLIQEKKKMRNIGSKNKRLHIRSEDAMELRLTWDEAQELLRPPPSAKPNIVMIEDHVFEEYDEPPVFGKRTIFAAGASGKQEQWAQCDSCFKWRRLPVDFLVPPKWSCLENIWDPSRCSCAASGEMNPSELERLLRVSRDFKQRRISGSPIVDPEQEHEPSGLDALARAAFLGEDQGETSAGPTTRHPRHRPGCTCIVCIQPPSGKGRHKPTCICNVCLTVKRRFKTLMLRKKKRLSEREGEICQERDRAESVPLANGSESNGANGNVFLCKRPLDSDRGQNKISVLDLNCDPNREEDVPEEGMCLDTCLGENEITEPKPCSGQPDAGMVEHHLSEEGRVSSMAEECENGEEHENKDEEG